MQDAFQTEIAAGKLYGRVGLQQHAALQSVHVESCHHRLLVVLCSLFIHDGSQGHDLFGSQSDCLRFLPALFVPEPFVLFLHAGEEAVEVHVPVHLVSVGNEETGNRLCRVTQSGTYGRVGKSRNHCGGVKHDAVRNGSSQLVCGAYTRNDEVDRRLLSGGQPSYQSEHRIFGLDSVTSAADVSVIAVEGCQPAEAGQRLRVSLLFQLVTDIFQGVIRTDV